MTKVTVDQLVERLMYSEPSPLSIYGIYVTSEQQFYRWKDGVYIPISPPELKKKIWTFLTMLKTEARGALQGFSITPRLVEDVYQGLILDTRNVRENTISPYITFSDGRVLSLDSFEVKDGNFDVESFYAVDVSSEEYLNAEDPIAFLKFLGEVLVLNDGVTPDEDMILFMQELFGYCLLEGVQAHATFFFYGSGRNGKSVLLDVLRSLIGDEYIANMTIQTLTTNRFSTFNLMGKKLNIASEEESKYIKSDMFKSLVAGDPITMERKYQDPISYRPQVKFLFATNVIPGFDSTDPAIRDRVHIIPFYRYFAPEDRDPSLLNKLKSELGPILAWAIEGAKRLIDNGYKFTVPNAVKEMSSTFQSEQSSALTFFEENYAVTSNMDDYVKKSDVYSLYQSWCRANGRQAMGSSRFFKDLCNVYGKKMDTSARKTDGANQYRVVAGISITDDATAFVHHPEIHML